MSTHTTLAHTTSSPGEHPKLTWHLSAYESARGGWQAVAELDQAAWAAAAADGLAGGPQAIRLEGHGPTRTDAITDLALKVTAFEAMAVEDLEIPHGFEPVGGDR